MDLIPKPPAKPGRKRNVTAKAWIVYRKGRRDFVSKVSLGQGKVLTLCTDTSDRSKALDFNRAHLMKLLTKRSRTTAAMEMQLELPVALPFVVQPLRASSSFRDKSKTP